MVSTIEMVANKKATMKKAVSLNRRRRVITGMHPPIIIYAQQKRVRPLA